MVHMFTVLLQEHKDTLKMMHTTKCRRDVVFSQTVSFINLFFFKYQLMHHSYFKLFVFQLDTLKMMHTTKCRRDVVFSQTVSFINLFFFKYQLKHHSYFRLFVFQLSISDLNSLHSTFKCMHSVKCTFVFKCINKFSSNICIKSLDLYLDCV